jgi:hypothetical protein
MKSKYNFSNQCYNDIVKLIINLIPTKHNMSKDLYQLKKIVTSLDLNYEKIDVRKKNYMLFWKEHMDDTKYMHCARSKYVKVVNDDGAPFYHKSSSRTTLLHVYITPHVLL